MCKNEHEYLRELYERGKCAITGVKFSGEGLNKASLDRIDSNKGECTMSISRGKLSERDK
jgi:hypothetical protein